MNITTQASPEMEAERARVLSKIRSHGPISFSCLAFEVGEIEHGTLTWHVLILQDRGDVVCIGRPLHPMFEAVE